MALRKLIRCNMSFRSNLALLKFPSITHVVLHVCLCNLVLGVGQLTWWASRSRSSQCTPVSLWQTTSLGSQVNMGNSRFITLYF